jgi:hypothetical protein
MCLTQPDPLTSAVQAALPYAKPAAAPCAEARQGSRRRRLWELDSHAYCPVVGVCLPIALLRRLADRTLGDMTRHSDYEVHCIIVTECKRRNPTSEALQKELERRYALVLRAAADLKHTEALAAWWRAAAAGSDWAGALWATLTHPRCTPALEHSVLGEAHMLQHQVGAATRADLTRLDTLEQENAVLTRELAAAQYRSRNQAAEAALRFEQQQGELLRARAELVRTATELLQQREQLTAMEQAAPALRERMALTEANRQQNEQLQQLHRALQQAQQEAERQRQRAEAAEAQTRQLRQRTAAEPAADCSHNSTPPLCNRAVLCVGGRTASVPVYRQVIEHTGARFLHHDGGEEDNSAQLDATLAAADLVICQAGCISHNAYWRVKDHCKRTGKQCVFVETPSRAALERALSEVTLPASA